LPPASVPFVHDLHAEAAQIVEAVALLLEGAQPAEMQVGERAGVEAPQGLDQRDREFRVAALEIARGGRTAEAAADHHDAPGGLLGDGRRG
jgi:hypothetical protein